METKTWALITGEYPPNRGGVADYSRLVARDLARAGDAVHVFTGPSAGPAPPDRAVSVQRLPGGFGPGGLAVLNRWLARLPRPLQLLVQYVPHAFGWKAMNLPFCLWLARQRDPLWVMFHEVAFPISRAQSWKHNLIGAVTHLMAGLLARAARRVFVSTPAWEPKLRRLAPRLAPCTWLPVPSNLEHQPVPAAVSLQRRLLAPDPATEVLGHFGTYGSHIAPLVRAVLPPLLKNSPRRVAVLLGRDGDRFARALAQEYPGLAGRLLAPGGLADEAVSVHLAACDLLLQPYSDGASCRRGSLMAGLALGLPIVTTEGPATEPLWRASRAVALVPTADAGAFVALAEALLACHESRRGLAERGRQLYQEAFRLERTLETLRSA